MTASMFTIRYVGQIYYTKTDSDICWEHDLLNEAVFQEFEAELIEFECKVKDTDRRLGAILCQAFDDASGLEHAFKVSDKYMAVFVAQITH